MRKDPNLTYADAILEYSAYIGLELETAAKLLTKELKDKMEKEAVRLHLFSKANKDKDEAV